jgi:hypothetical protein
VLAAVAALLCAVAGRALPELRPEASRVNRDGTLVLLHLRELRAEPRTEWCADGAACADALYGSVVTQLQAIEFAEPASGDQLSAIAPAPDAVAERDTLPPPIPSAVQQQDAEQSMLWQAPLRLSLGSRIQHKG